MTTDQTITALRRRLGEISVLLLQNQYEEARALLQGVKLKFPDGGPHAYLINEVPDNLPEPDLLISKE